VGDGLEVSHGGAPDGAPVVFVHGAMDSGRAFLRTTELLPETSWWFYDRRGYGRSAASQPVDFGGHVGDLVTVLDHVRSVDGTAPVLVGHSLGGAIALAATDGRPDLVAALVTYDAPLPWAPWWSMPIPVIEPWDPEGEAERFLRLILGDEGWEALTPETQARKGREGLAWVTEIPSAQAWDRFTAGRIEVPALFATGTSAQSGQHRRAADELVAEAPHGRRILVQGAPHAAHLTHPEEIARLVRVALSTIADPVDGN